MSRRLPEYRELELLDWPLVDTILCRTHLAGGRGGSDATKDSGSVDDCHVGVELSHLSATSSKPREKTALG